MLPTPKFTVRADNNYQIRQELLLDEKMSTIGFSWGFGLRISRFQINYVSARYHLAGSSNLISIALNMNDGYRKNEVKIYRKKERQNKSIVEFI